MEFVAGATPIGPTLRQQQPVALAYIPGLGYVVKAIKAVRAAGPVVERVTRSTFLLLGGLAEAVIKSAPHQGPGLNRATVGTGTIDGLLNALDETGLRKLPAGAGQEPGEVDMLPMWRADP